MEEKIGYGKDGVFFGYTTMPVENSCEFYDKIILEKLFKKYKGYLEENIKCHPSIIENKIGDFLYSPIPYYIFGSYDLFLLSLIDDFEFPIRKFAPYIEGNNNSTWGTIFHHGQIGLNIYYNDPIENIWVDPTLTTRHPLIGITRIKLSNFFTMSGGFRFVLDTITSIKSKIKKLDKSNVCSYFHFSYSWNELIIIFLSNSFNSISEIVMEISKINFGNMLDDVVKEYPTQNKDLYESYYIINNSVKKKLYGEDDEIAKNDLNKKVIIKKFYTILGFHLDILRGYQGNNLNKEKVQRSEELINNIDQSDLFSPLCKWFWRSISQENQQLFYSLMGSPEHINIHFGSLSIITILKMFIYCMY